MSNDPKMTRGGHAVRFPADGADFAPQPCFDEHPPQMMDLGAGASPLTG
jgi:hypothetical protein